MKKTSDIKYPSSANLFQFCRLVLDHKFGGVRVIDQDVGQILGFDPADCSHWKKGKKNIRSIQAMKSIAEHLGVDERLVVDVAAGELDENEAFFEYTGYGAFDIDPKLVEAAKKDFYRKNASNWSKEKEQEFKMSLDIDEPMLDELVKDIHAKINFSEAPLYLPEVAGHYTEIKFATTTPPEDPTKIKVEHETKDNTHTIQYPQGTEARPYVRFRIAASMGHYFIAQKRRLHAADLDESARYVLDVQANLFAAKLLTPANLIRKEMQQINVAKDIISQLAEIFWVSKTFMNRRLKVILQNQSAI